MIRSMTGYGSGESEKVGIRTTVEIRSVNGRFNEISIKLPKAFSSLEGRIREQIQGSVSRGNLSVSVRREGDASNGTLEYEVDMNAGQRYLEALRTLQEELNVSGEITLEMIAAYPSLLKPAADSFDLDQAWLAVQPALTDALSSLTEMKEREGNQLATDLISRIEHIKSLLDSIANRAPQRIEDIRQRLHDKINTLLGEENVDPQRLAMEVTIFADRCDITEECVRFNSHNIEFLNALETNNVAGRRLNFLLQEMNREANTIGSKSNDIEISHQVITIKEELEKIREQVQNIE